jgi:2-keto-4-pentenoate hydratase
MKLWEDPRVQRGLRAQLELRRTRLAGGDAALGWKVGFGAPAMLQLLQISGPLTGFLTQKARVQSGSTVSLAGWVKPVAEPEIAVHIGKDVPAGADAATARAAIAGISPAIELVDLITPPADPEKILAGNIYQRHVVLGTTAPARAGASAEGLDCRIIRRGAESARTVDPQANTGQWLDIVQHVASVLAAFGERLKAGEIIITGSVVPPITIDPDERAIAFEVDPIGSVSVRFG